MEEKKHIRISELAYAVGYNDPRYFSSSFKKKSVCSPPSIWNVSLRVELLRENKIYPVNVFYILHNMLKNVSTYVGFCFMHQN